MMTPQVAFEVLKLLNPRLECIHHPGVTGKMQNSRGMHYRVYAYPHLAYFAFETEIDWPDGMDQYPVASVPITDETT